MADTDTILGGVGAEPKAGSFDRWAKTRKPSPAGRSQGIRRSGDASSYKLLTGTRASTSVAKESTSQCP